MPTVELEAEIVRYQLERILGSPGFVRNERLSGFLRFVVDRYLEGRGTELKESVIGTEVFGRKLDYSPKFDPIVRTEARRLRARLSEYYAISGASDPLIIELPKGGYVPVVRLAPQVPQKAGSSQPRPKKWSWAALGLVAFGILVAAVVWLRLGPAHRPQPPANSMAYDLYLRARASEMRPAVRGVEDSIDLFTQAISKDPSFAPAYAGLAAMEAARSAFDRFSVSERAVMISKGWTAVDTAIRLDSRLADAYDALGMMQAREAQWQYAEHSFRRAIEFAPNEPLWRNHFAMFLLLPLGRIEEALGQLRTAEELDARSLETHHALDLALRANGRFDDAEFHCHRAAENNQQLSGCWAQTLLRQGKVDEAVRMLEEQWNGHLLVMGAQFLGVAYAQAGRHADAERVAALVPRLANKAQIFAALSDKDRTLKVLDQMAPMGPTRVGRELIAPEFASLRGDPRLKAIRIKVGLPD